MSKLRRAARDTYRRVAVPRTGRLEPPADGSHRAQCPAVPPATERRVVKRYTYDVDHGDDHEAVMAEMIDTD